VPHGRVNRVRLARVAAFGAGQVLVVGMALPLPETETELGWEKVALPALERGV